MATALWGAISIVAVPAAQAWLPSADITPAPQAATWTRGDPLASAGVVAEGYFYDQWIGGARRSFSITFASPSPSSVAVGGGPAGGADLARAFLHVRERGAPDGLLVPVPGVSGAEHQPTLCEILVNPPHFDAGRAGPDGSYGDESGPSWTGVWADFTCDDGSGFDFYRVRFDNGRMPDGTPAFVMRRLTYTGSPFLPGNWGVFWSNRMELFSWGQMTVFHDGFEPASATLCGHRNGQPPECIGSPWPGGGNGSIMPFVFSVTATVAGTGTNNV